MSLRDYLATTAKAWRSIASPPGVWLVEELLVRKGVIGSSQPLPDGYDRGLPQRCYSNTVGVVRRDSKLRFVEGLACRTDFPVPFLHAWAIDGSDRVVDVTLDRPDECEYVGYPMLLAKRKHWLAKDSISVFDTGRGPNYKFIFHEDPTLLDLVDESHRAFVLSRGLARQHDKR